MLSQLTSIQTFLSSSKSAVTKKPGYSMVLSLSEQLMFETSKFFKTLLKLNLDSMISKDIKIIQMVSSSVNISHMYDVHGISKTSEDFRQKLEQKRSENSEIIKFYLKTW